MASLREASRGEEWGQEKATDSEWQARAARDSRRAGHSAAAMACPVSKQAGGGRRVGGLGCKNRKVQGAIYKLKITIDLGLKIKSAQNKSCSVFQDLQLSCCANFTRSKDFEIF